MSSLIGKTALVTGGARGIGQAIAMAFAKEGAEVAVLDRRKEDAEQTAARIRDLGVKGVAISADVGDESQINAAVETAIFALGRIDILVNNAGIESASYVVDMPTDMWDRMMLINLRSVFLCTRAVLPGMRERKHGRIINISSQLAHKGAKELSHYAAAKAGVIGFTRSLAYEVADQGITANAICPGPVDTELFRSLPETFRRAKLAELPIGRAASVDEIAPAAVLLASDAGSYFLGATINPNGGDYMI
ncbi:SDR family NAD(P)-dependent oxidoreductase [Paraburkholderia tuberum]|uniref:3-oxoacyl-[acyl-carrier protein] reductase n=1 Tax=Paraburkholderia tuberum TaxID=157910 RepID=A0A1H1KIC9_9BURK|nr:3-oxoacyl-ACP reductase family protein [Paraburkholderia tuberum]SDR62063.1 3-oxoacyl-[acyl-carrier protein] reductase [Paraburkholderia tuberum]